MGKALLETALLTALLLFSVIGYVCLANAQTSPSIPEFTLKFVDNSYDYLVAPVTTTTMDPYTGVTNSSTQPGYTVHVENKSIIITIKNKPFTPSQGNQYLFYAVRVKGHYVTYWGSLYGEGTYSTQDWMPPQTAPPQYPSTGNMPQQSSSEYTILTDSVNGIGQGSQLDFQVQAVTGYDAQAWHSDPDHPLLFGVGGMGPVIAVNQRSGWSETQTITIPESSPSNAPTSSVTATPVPTLAPNSTETSTLTPSPAITPLPINQTGVPVWLYIVTALMALAIGLLLGVVAMQRRAIRRNNPAGL
jgi:hypothetical protein